LDEQLAAVTFIDEAVTKFSEGAKILSREIELLNEFRTRLIADVVTGKVDVREVATKLPDEPPEEAAEVLAEKEIVEDDGVGDEPGLETVAGERER
jgi:type I restriction enzyme S subunit